MKNGNYTFPVVRYFIGKLELVSGIDKRYLYAKDLSKPKYQFLIKKGEDAGIKHLNDSNTFIECSNTMDDVYVILMIATQKNKNVVFDDMIPDIMTNEKFQAIIEELFIRCRKLNTLLVFIAQSYFAVPKDVRLYSTHYLIMKTENKRESHSIGINYSADIDYNDFVKIYRDGKKELYFFFTIHTTLPASDPLRFRKNLLSFL